MFILGYLWFSLHLCKYNCLNSRAGGGGAHARLYACVHVCVRACMCVHAWCLAGTHHFFL